jgi:hypothetical protein
MFGPSSQFLCSFSPGKIYSCPNNAKQILCYRVRVRLPLPVVRELKAMSPGEVLGHDRVHELGQCSATFFHLWHIKLKM